jgi:hypothetical protein
MLLLFSEESIEFFFFVSSGLYFYTSNFQL